MSNFDWYSEEDKRWGPEPAEEPPEPRHPRRWPFLLLAIAALAAVGVAVVYRQADERITAAETAVRADVQAAHTLMIQAGTDGDVDLFRAGLSGRQPDWTAAQTALVEDGNLWDRAPFGLLLLPASADSSPEIDVATDLRSAEVTYKLPYQLGDSTVDLRHTAVYRRGENRWLMAPPEADFWGTWVTNRGEYLTLTYPQRDAAMSERLAFDLDRMMRKLCATFTGLLCPANMNLAVRFATQPDSLVDVFDVANALQSPVQVNLPAPTLLGIPLNDAGYEALYKGYATQIVLAAMADLQSYECCRRGLYFRALADWQLSQLNLAEWPLTPEIFETLLQQDLLPMSPLPGWRSTDVSGQNSSDWSWAYGFVQYLIEEKGLDAAILQGGLNQDYQDWLNAAGIDLEAESTDWVAFLYAHSTSGQLAQSDMPEPGSYLNVVCTSPTGTAQTVYRYNFSTDTWQPALMSDGSADYVYIYPTDIPDALFVLEATGVGDEPDSNTFTSASFLWQNGRRIPIYDSAEQAGGGENVTSVAYPVGTDPQQRYFQVLIYSEGPDGYLARTEIRLVDLSTCTSAGCDYIVPDYSPFELAWPPEWSPTGEHMLMTEQPIYYTGTAIQTIDAPIYLTDVLEQDQVLVGEGNNPFWLNGRSYGYLRTAEDGMMEVVTAVIGDNTPQVLLTASDLQAALPETDEKKEEAPVSLEPAYLLPNPAVSDEFLVVAHLAGDRGDREDLFMLRHVGTVEQTLTHLETILRGGAGAFSPNGRYLHVIAHNFATGQPHTESILFDLQTGEKETLTMASTYYFNDDGWSQDGDWLLQVFSEYALLYAPEVGYRRLVQLTMPDCEAPFWSAK